MHLLAAILDQKSISTERAGYEREEIDALLDALAPAYAGAGDHPLSIELVAPHLKTLTPQTIRGEFDQLLARFADGSAFEGRKRSLLASLAFSSRRLSQAAQAALPYLAWFEGGAFGTVHSGLYRPPRTRGLGRHPRRTGGDCPGQGGRAARIKQPLPPDPSHPAIRRPGRGGARPGGR